jgi:hypothetical protein
MTMEVQAVRWEQDGTIELEFENGCTLTLLDSENHYESYQIHHPDGTIVV